MFYPHNIEEYLVWSTQVCAVFCCCDEEGESGEPSLTQHTQLQILEAWGLPSKPFSQDVPLAWVHRGEAYLMMKKVCNRGSTPHRSRRHP